MWQLFLRPIPLAALILGGSLMVLKLFTYGAIALLGWLFLVGLEASRTSNPSSDERSGTLDKDG
jgi:hypothetical protein